MAELRDEPKSAEVSVFQRLASSLLKRGPINYDAEIAYLKKKEELPVYSQLPRSSGPLPKAKRREVVCLNPRLKFDIQRFKAMTQEWGAVIRALALRGKLMRKAQRRSFQGRRSSSPAISPPASVPVFKQTERSVPRQPERSMPRPTERSVPRDAEITSTQRPPTVPVSSAAAAPLASPAVPAVESTNSTDLKPVNIRLFSRAALCKILGKQPG